MADDSSGSAGSSGSSSPSSTSPAAAAAGAGPRPRRRSSGGSGRRIQKSIEKSLRGADSFALPSAQSPTFQRPVLDTTPPRITSSVVSSRGGANDGGEFTDRRSLCGCGGSGTGDDGSGSAGFGKRMFPVIRELELSTANKRIIWKRYVKVAREAMERAGLFHAWSNRLDMVVLWGGIIVSSLIVVQHSQQIRDAGSVNEIFWSTFGLSLVVNLATGTQQRFMLARLADIYSETFDRLERAGWAFFSLSGQYTGSNHELSFPTFMNHVERIRREQQTLLRAVYSSKGSAADDGPDQPAPPDAPAPPAAAAAPALLSDGGGAGPPPRSP